ncbi:MAG: AAA family ATPase, partial [Aestuariivirgaceae bacterium]
ELEINQPHAPQIYLGIVPVCRMPDGELAIGGTGKPVEWTVHMHRFDDHALLATAIGADPPSLPFYDRLADEIASYHAKASVIADRNGAAAMQVIVDELREAFASAGDVIGRTRQAEFDRLLSGQLDTCRHRLDQRARRGYLRRCHGDLHLGNIVVLSGRPVLFDAIEFSEEFASIDTLYDLAFLIMDLDKRGMRPEANRLLNRYLSQTGDPANIAALQAMPLFLSCRAAIRAMVAITRMRQASSNAAGTKARSEALDYFRVATGFLNIERPKLICIGGLSGTGKTTMARRLAPATARPPGALHLRSDVERKNLFGVDETERLEAGAYTLKVSARIYARLMHKAKLALLAGSSVIVDAVFLNDHERHHAERTAQSAGAMFSGLWLEADETAMISRVTARTGDASDATASVVR